MTNEAKAARAAYKRKWAHENPERVKQYQSRYWEKKAADAQREKLAQPEKQRSAPEV